MPPSVSAPTALVRARLTIGRRPSAGPFIAVAIAALGAAALSIDVVRTTYGIKGDEATYVAMALSVAHDGDLQYERRDLERFWRIYQSGPEGIFLKRGARLAVAVLSRWPFVETTRTPDAGGDRLFFGKAFVYSASAAPFVRLAGLNGMLLFQVLLWGGVLTAGYAFCRARTDVATAATMALAFFGLSITPLYLVWLTPEIYHVALVTFAYFLWFYKRVVPEGTVQRRLWSGLRSDVVGAVLLGVAAFSKPPNVLLIVPPVVASWKERRRAAGVVTLATFGATVGLLFGINAIVSGDFNYQGGDRRTFYGHFPFERSGARFETLGIPMTTNELGADEVENRGELSRTLAHNVGYFLWGRHTGFLPYFFPGAVVLFLWARARREWRLWHWALLAVLGASVAALLVTLPYSWAGGGGPPGNRYFLSLYPALLFVLPSLHSVRGPLLAVLGGALFLMHIVINPFVAAKAPWLNAQHGLLRMLPVELTMVNDLPVMLDSGRSRIPYGDPVLFLYFLDDNAWRPEPAGIWIAGGKTSEIIVRTDRPLARIAFQLQSIVPNDVAVSAGGRVARAKLAAGTPATLVVPAQGVETRGAWAYVVRISCTRGAIPALVERASEDPRHLGVLVQMIGQPAS